MQSPLTPRERRCLAQAHESGYLCAACSDNRRILRAHGLWCWRLKLPLVWFERTSPRSHFGTLRLDMLTTPHMLTGAGQSALKALGSTAVSPHDALWERVPFVRLDKLAHAALRAVLQVRHYRVNRAPAVSLPLRLVPRKIASA